MQRSLLLKLGISLNCLYSLGWIWEWRRHGYFLDIGSIAIGREHGTTDLDMHAVMNIFMMIIQSLQSVFALHVDARSVHSVRYA